jgi:superfamily II DNA or RNA helicase
LYKAIEHRKIASVGYYLGGMKQKDLKISETKQIVIATYSMASEGLDIKTLTTLILATPKTEVEQAVGRIMRIKHEQPLIIDIIDTHDIFKKQWIKRRAFYQKNNYKIVSTMDYRQGQWKEITKTSKNKNNKNNKNNLSDENDAIPMGKCLIAFNDLELV